MRSIYIALIIALSSCTKNTVKSSSSYNNSCDTISFQLLINILESDINKLPTIKCFEQRDTMIEGDEGASWRGKAFYLKKEIIFVAETNWENNNIVKRITISNSLIKDQSIFIGQTFGQLKLLVDTDIPTSPDGYLFLKLKKQDCVYIQLDISNEKPGSPLFYGANNIKDIPENLKVESIIIMKSE